MNTPLLRRLSRFAVLLVAIMLTGCDGTTPAPARDRPGSDADATHPAGALPDASEQTSTYLRCYYRKSDDPFRFDVGYVWAIDPHTDWFYRLPGGWRGDDTRRWAPIFPTTDSTNELRSLCEGSLRRHGITAELTGWAARANAFAIDATPWSAGGPGARIDRVVAFGDSLSDTHNLYDATYGRVPDGTSWFDGRFTNGRNWVEYLADDLNVPLYDWAVGGTGVSDRRVLQWVEMPGLLSQVRDWRRATRADRSYDPARTLFTVLVGGNDLIYFDTPPDEILAKEREAIDVLIDAGAKNILVLNLPDVSRAPIFKLKGGADRAAAQVEAINVGLRTMIASMQDEHAGSVNIQLFDTHALFARLFDEPRVYGFSNSTESCLEMDRTGLSNFMESHRPRPACRNPDTFVFWDVLHPTTRTHRLLADRVAAFVHLHFPAAAARES
ncbi:TPA: SGNH/GDSL hydrolase family protein [Burkholderia cenocepacia]|uniref:SGNH/GDSL hydrolase family protein n=1 Tax=unclassified Burkholderia TaxID=2613784 RepID=UPI001589263D|nr:MULTISPECIES: SGNH/GDSL hydrolase family protein [unclassified Burkholderia]HEF5875078.1 SGNH/GDSL hydrolase family protein [Burkholderia cenocepacia]